MSIGNKIYSTGETKPFQDGFRWCLLGWGELNQERGGCCTLCRELPSKKHGVVTNMQKTSLNLIRAKQRCCIQRYETEYFPSGAILPVFTLIVQPQCRLGRVLLAMQSTEAPQVHLVGAAWHQTPANLIKPWTWKPHIIFPSNWEYAQRTQLPELAQRLRWQKTYWYKTSISIHPKLQPDLLLALQCLLSNSPFSRFLIPFSQFRPFPPTSDPHRPSSTVQLQTLLPTHTFLSSFLPSHRAWEAGLTHPMVSPPGIPPLLEEPTQSPELFFSLKAPEPFCTPSPTVTLAVLWHSCQFCLLGKNLSLLSAGEIRKRPWTILVTGLQTQAAKG